MKSSSITIALLVALAFPLSAQTLSNVTAVHDGPPTGSANADAAISYFQYGWGGWGVTNASNYLSFSGNFQSGVTARVGMQDYSLWLQNQNSGLSNVAIADTTWSEKTWPVMGTNPNCVSSWYVVACPPGESAWIVVEPIPDSTVLSASVWSTTGCYRSIAVAEWVTIYTFGGWYQYPVNNERRTESGWAGPCSSAAAY